MLAASLRRFAPGRGIAIALAFAAPCALYVVHGTTATSPPESASAELVQPPVMLRRHHTLQVTPPPADSPALLRTPAPRRGSPVADALANIVVNDPYGEMPGTGNTQMEPSVASNGDTLVCGFTDSRGLWAGGNLSGYAVSYDGGYSWIDRGSLPQAVSPMLVYGDPTLVTDGAGLWFYLSELDRGNGTGGPGSGDLSLALHRGRFVGGALQWDAPWIVAGGGGQKLDSAHLAIDRPRDRLYITYSNLTANYGAVEVVVLDQRGSHLLYQVVVQPEVIGNSQAGSRLAVGPDGEVYCAFESGLFGVEGQGPGVQKVARSLDNGATWSAPVAAANVIQSWLSGPPGANREEESVEYPSLAVDCSNGPNRGRVYLTWHDGVQRLFSGALLDVSEAAGANGAPQDAQPLPVTPLLNVGWKISGTFGTTDYGDWYRFAGRAGEHLRLVTSPGIATLHLRMQLRCMNPLGGGADTTLAASFRSPGDQVSMQFTLPSDGDYVLGLSRHSSASGAYTAYIRRAIGVPSVAIDQRDVVLVSSPDGVSAWTPKKRVNDDTGFTDQVFPEVVVDGDGGVHVMWYDRRFDAHCRALADMMLSTSSDGGNTFAPAVRISTGSSWWQVPADAVPNFGDQFRPEARGERLHIVWADGRSGDPDVDFAPLRTGFAVTAPADLSARAGQPLGLAGTLKNDTPYSDALFVVQMNSDDAVIPDSTWTVGPVAAGQTVPWRFEPIVGGALPTTAVVNLALRVVSNRSAAVRQAAIVVHADVVPVELRDFSLTAAANGMRLEWRAGRDAQFHVERAAAAVGPFERLTVKPLGNPAGRFEFVDESVPVSAMAWYRLVGLDAAGTAQFFGPYAAQRRDPARVVLHGASPNPFNPSTEIRFDLPRPGPVTLRIIDARGRLVAVLLDGASRAAGSHAVRWDARSRDGGVLSSGVYWAQLDLFGTRRTARLILVR